MGDRWSIDRPRPFQFNGLSADLIEQSPAIAEQYGHEVDLNLVKQPGTQNLLDDVRAPGNRDILISGNCFGSTVTFAM